MDEKQPSDDVSESLGETRPTTPETPYAVEPVPDVYPLRDPSEDPRWALWVIGIWMSIAIFLFLFFVVLFFLGIWYD
jgi:hypothetical protein